MGWQEMCPVQAVLSYKRENLKYVEKFESRHLHAYMYITIHNTTHHGNISALSEMLAWAGSRTDTRA